MNTEIRYTWFFEHAPETVWEYLTDTELLAQWLMKNDIRPVVGHKFRFTTTPLPQYNFDGIVYCEVLEVIPSRKLAYSWRGGPGDGPQTLDSVVTWTLAPKDNGTELHLVHSGFTEANAMTFYSMNKGWGGHIKDRLYELLNNTGK